MTLTPHPASSGWHDGLLLGHDPMDQVHEEFVELIDALVEAAGAAVAPALAALAEHARDHFDTENAWMRATDFPARECHIAEHDAVLRSIDGVRARAARGDLTAAAALARELAAWFPAHCEYLDAALVHWICKQRHGAKPIVLRRRLGPSPAAVAA